MDLKFMDAPGAFAAPGMHDAAEEAAATESLLAAVPTHFGRFVCFFLCLLQTRVATK
jgi:hypothetical protein